MRGVHEIWDLGYTFTPSPIRLTTTTTQEERRRRRAPKSSGRKILGSSGTITFSAPYLRALPRHAAACLQLHISWGGRCRPRGMMEPKEKILLAATGAYKILGILPTTCHSHAWFQGTRFGFCALPPFNPHEASFFFLGCASLSQLSYHHTHTPHVGCAAVGGVGNIRRRSPGKRPPKIELARQAEGGGGDLPSPRSGCSFHSDYSQKNGYSVSRWQWLHLEHPLAPTLACPFAPFQNTPPCLMPMPCLPCLPSCALCAAFSQSTDESIMFCTLEEMLWGGRQVARLCLPTIHMCLRVGAKESNTGGGGLQPMRPRIGHLAWAPGS